jgi:predicted nucleotidyltransferase
MMLDTWHDRTIMSMEWERLGPADFRSARSMPAPTSGAASGAGIAEGSSMNAMVQEKLAEVSALCVKRGVRRLALFGSAARGAEARQPADLDFLVEFRPMSPVRQADGFFGLQEDLEHLFGCSVDLVEPAAIGNPYFREAVEESKVVLYDEA